MKAAAYDIMAELEESYWWYRARREILFDVVTRVVPRGSDIIDFGAGTGGTAGLLSERGYRVIAADVSQAALARCRIRGLETWDLRQEPLRRACADCILAGDVLEHIADDVGLLISLRRSLRPGGILVATVPAYEFLWSGEDYISEHLRRYTRATLNQRLLIAGFEIMRCSYFNTLLFPAILAVTLTKRLIFPREMYRSDVAPLPKWQNDVLYRIFSFEGRLLQRLSFPVGASVLAVARFVEGERCNSESKEGEARSGA